MSLLGAERCAGTTPTTTQVVELVLAAGPPENNATTTNVVELVLDAAPPENYANHHAGG